MASVGSGRGSSAQGLFAIVDFAVAIILFEGGLNLRALAAATRPVVAIRRLITWGARDHARSGVPSRCTILARLGIDGVAPLRRTRRRDGSDRRRSAGFGAAPASPRVATVLEAEGVLIDPIGAILAVRDPEASRSRSDPGSLLVGQSGGAGLAAPRGGLGARGRRGIRARSSSLRVSRLLPDGLRERLRPVVGSAALRGVGGAALA